MTLNEFINRKKTKHKTRNHIAHQATIATATIKYNTSHLVKYKISYKKVCLGENNIKETFNNNLFLKKITVVHYQTVKLTCL